MYVKRPCIALKLNSTSYSSIFLPFPPSSLFFITLHRQSEEVKTVFGFFGYIGQTPAQPIRYRTLPSFSSFLPSFLPCARYLYLPSTYSSVPTDRQINSLHLTSSLQAQVTRTCRMQASFSGTREQKDFWSYKNKKWKCEKKKKQQSHTRTHILMFKKETTKGKGNKK